eukprot:m.61195 g.61195  ORF g.61195 m.61195 type:complete len:583 (+) comp12331_c0_seq2:54-1802(+)
MPPKTIAVVVSTMDAEMEFAFDPRNTGEQLFEQVVRTIGLRETWYFDLAFTDSAGTQQWLKRHKKVVVQDVPRVQPLTFRLLAKFYPEDVEAELIQDITQHLFYLQVQQLVLGQEIFCPPEAAVLLASYAVQAKFGDHSEALHKKGFLAGDIPTLLPARVIAQFQMTPQMWEDRITACYTEHRGLARIEAELEYLKIAQDLEMYGVNYFEIKNKKETGLFLGVDALGLNVYSKEDKLSPKTTFPWGEIRHISYSDKKFTIKSTDDKTDFSFFTVRPDVSKTVLQLCVGNHELYIRRRNLDTMEVQQMKAMAAEEKARRAAEQGKLMKEKEQREIAEREKQKLLIKLEKMKKQAAQAQRSLLRSDETAQLLAEKIEIAEVETGLLLRKAHEAEAAYARVRQEQARTEDEKRTLERKVQEAEQLARQMAEETQRRQAEMHQLQRDLEAARIAEREAKQQVASMSAHASTAASRVMTPNLLVAGLEGSGSESGSLAEDADHGGVALAAAPGSHDDGDGALAEYAAKSAVLHKQLAELKSDMEGHQIPGGAALLPTRGEGQGKFDTLRRIRKAGSAKARIAFFEEL